MTSIGDAYVGIIMVGAIGAVLFIEWCKVKISDRNRRREERMEIIV